MVTGCARTRARNAAVGVLALVAGHPGAAGGLELPGPGTLLGTGDPFAIFPDSLPTTGAFRSRLELRELYRYEQGREFQDYDLWNAQSLVMIRTGPLWLGLRYGKAGLALDQREVYDERDVFRGRRDVDHLAVALAARSKRGELRAFLGGSSGAEAGLRYRTPDDGGASMTAWWWLSQGETHLSQKVRDATFFFPFRYHENAVGAEVTWQPWGRRAGVAASYRRVAGEEPHPDQYNRLDLDRWRLAASLSGRGADASLTVEHVRAGVEMAVDGTVYARARDVGVTRADTEIGWRFRRWLRLAAGYDYWRVRSDDPTFADVWPFTIWDVFTGTRYRLESTDSRLGMAHARAEWSWQPGPVTLELGTRYEWWDSAGELFWKERVATLPPFFFRFDHHRDSLVVTPTNGAQMDLSGRYDTRGGWFVQLGAQLAVPLGRRRSDDVGSDPPVPPPAAGPDEPESVRGGLQVVTTVGATW